ncbi:MAG: 4-hydroxy-tetrahydrodipicolinate synthase [Spirochaetia bacterium]|nr:4-hydroxy-tetrahydrodipicolinate synthase [Spirochaetia bacterium]
MKFEGIYTALITPFNKDESIDWGALKALVDFQVESGVAGIAPMGTTGESPTIIHEDHLKIIEFVARQAAGRCQIIAGAGSNSTAEALHMTKVAASYGVDATLQVAPYYNKPSMEGFYRHFMTIADAVDIPMVVYNIPGRTGKNIDNATMLRLAKHPNIQAVKEASGDVNQMMNLIAAKPDTFTVLSGDDNLGFLLIAMGGKGIVSVASNLYPKEMNALCNATLAGNLEEAKKLHYKMLPFFRAEFADTNPVPIKYAMAKAGMIQEAYRLPLCETSAAVKAQVDAAMAKLAQ